MNKIFNEKYRPTEFENIIGLDEQIINLVESKNIPHLLFVGPAGTGKTTTAKVIIKKLDADCLLLNASKDRGIDIIRLKIEPFATKACDKLKIVFLDEFDATTPAFQTALRNFMETHARTTRFIATCNYPNKIIPPLKSRFKPFIFSKYDKDSKFSYLKRIVEAENINISDDALAILVQKNKDDIRSMVNFLDGNKFKNITKEDIGNDDIILKILSKLKDKKWYDIRQELLNESLDYNALIDEMDYIIFAHKTIPEIVKRKANLIAQKYQYQMNFSFNQEICFSAYMAEIQEILQW